MALLLAAFTAFNPLLLYDTGVWKQIDGAFALPLLLCFLLLEQRRYLPAAVWFGLALAIKPQALLFGPVLAVCFLAGIALEKDKYRALGRCFGGAALALVPPLAAGLPFFGAVQLVPKLIEKYTGTMSGYPYASINAFNWLAALGGNWKSLCRYSPARHKLEAVGLGQHSAGHGRALSGLRRAVRGRGGSRRCCWRRITVWAFSRWPTVCTSAIWCPVCC